jgi:hypothetical protein
MSMVSGVSVQVSDNRGQMTEISLPLVFCHLFSVLDSAEPFGRELRVERLVAGCPLYVPDT